MRHDTCCVVNCKKNGRHSDHKFYKFPQASWKREQRIKWIIAVKRKKFGKTYGNDTRDAKRWLRGDFTS